MKKNFEFLCSRVLGVNAALWEFCFHFRVGKGRRGGAAGIGRQSTRPETTKYASCASVVVAMSTSSSSVDHWLCFHDVFFVFVWFFKIKVFFVKFLATAICRRLH